MSSFWQTWLKLWAWGVILFGVVLASGTFAATDAMVRPLFALLGNSLAAEPDAHHRFSIGLMGALSIGWGATLLGIFAAIPTLTPAAAAPFWRAVLGGTLVWYAVDGAISIATGFALNVAPNTLLLGLLCIALFKSGALQASAD